MKKSFARMMKGSWTRILALVVLGVGFFVFHVWVRTRSLATGYVVGEQRRRVNELEAEAAALRVERGRIMGPENLARLVKDWEAQGTRFEAPKSSQLIYESPRAR